MPGYIQDFGQFVSTRPGKTATTDYGPQYLGAKVTNPAAGATLLDVAAPGSPNRWLFIKRLYVRSSVAGEIQVTVYRADGATVQEQFLWAVSAGVTEELTFDAPLRVIPGGGSVVVTSTGALTGTVYVLAHGWYEAYFGDVVNG